MYVCTIFDDDCSCRIFSPYQEIKIKNEGMPKRGSYSHKTKSHAYGDLIVQFVIAFPEALGPNDKKVIRDVLKKLR